MGKILMKVSFLLVGLVLVASVFLPFAEAVVVQCFEVMFRGRVVGRPDFGGTVGVSAVNVQVETIIHSQLSELKIGDVTTVSWPIVPRYLNMSAQVGDVVEVYGLCCKDTVPSWWSNAGPYMISITANDQYYMTVIGHPEPSTGPPWWLWAIIIAGTGIAIGSMIIASRKKLERKI